MKGMRAALLLLLAASVAAAQATYKLTWSVAGFVVGGTTFSTLELDIAETGRYLSAHGAILTEARQLSPVTGTCSRTTTGYFCNLQVDRSSLFMAVDNQLNGRIFGRDGSGTALTEVAMTLLSRQ